MSQQHEQEKPQKITKFILLGHGRSGSTLLSLTLGKHPNIRMFLELFHDDERERELSFRADKRFYRDGEDAVEFLREAVFYPRYWKQLKAVGFKLFYDHARSTKEGKKLWSFLKINKNIYIIHLIRQNILESWISYQTALRSDVWTLMEQDKQKVPKVERFELDARGCEDFFKYVEEQRMWARSFFSHHPFIEIEYEKDLCQNFHENIFKVQDFLGVPRLSTPILTKKQANLTPRQQISNYDKLKSHFAGTVYSEFFRA